MASAEAAPAAAPLQTFVLKVSIHCHGCKKKVRKVLKSIEGVHDVKVDAAQHKVTVTGTVDPATLVQRLHKSGKQALLWQHGHAEPAKKPEAAPAPPAGNDAAAEKKPEEPVKEPKAESAEKKPEVHKGAESEKKAEKEEAKKEGGESAAAEPKEAAVAAAKEAGSDDGEAKKKQSKPKDAGEAKPVTAATTDRSLSPASAPAQRHAHEGYSPYYAPQPVLSYHMAQPRPSVSYYAPQPEQAYSTHQQRPEPAYSMQQQPMQQWSPSYLYMPYPHGAPEPYYQDYYSSPPGTNYTPPPPPMQDSYRLFDDENPNSCSVM